MKLKYTNPFLYISQIANNTHIQIPQDMELALAENGYQGFGKIISNEYVSWKGTYSDEEFWRKSRENMGYFFRQRMKPSFKDNKTISLFPLGPMPTLIELGTKLGRSINLDLYQIKKSPNYSWLWDKEGRESLSFHISSPKNFGIKNKNVLKISVGSNLSTGEIKNTLGLDQGINLWTLSCKAIKGRERDLIRTPQDIVNFSQMVREVMDLIKDSTYIQNAVFEEEDLHVFMAMPTTCCIEFGRQWDPATHPNLHLYNRTLDNTKTIKALTIHKKELCNL